MFAIQLVARVQIAISLRGPSGFRFSAGMLGSHFIFINCNTHNGLIFGPNGVLRAPPPNQSTITHMTAYLQQTACLDLKLSQNMVTLPSVMSNYNIETMLGSHFIFNDGNVHNGLIFERNGCSEPPKPARLHTLTACHVLKLSQNMVPLPSAMSTYNIETTICWALVLFSIMATRTMN